MAPPDDLAAWTETLKRFGTTTDVEVVVHAPRPAPPGVPEALQWQGTATVSGLGGAVTVEGQGRTRQASLRVTLENVVALLARIDVEQAPHCVARAILARMIHEHPLRADDGRVHAAWREAVTRIPDLPTLALDPDALIPRLRDSVRLVAPDASPDELDALAVAVLDRLTGKRDVQ